jgi:dihydropteroate synthase
MLNGHGRSRVKGRDAFDFGVCGGQKAPVILARAICADEPGDLELALRRMGLPTAAAEYVLEKSLQAQVLLTGIGPTEGRFLKALAEQSTAPGTEVYPRYVPGNVQRRPGTALLSGRRDQFERLIAAADEGPLAPLRAALSRLLLGAPPSLRLGGREWALGTRTFVMGILNVTPDSFSDGGRFFSPDRAIAQGLVLAREGADIIDIGGESTRPGAKAVTAAEELERVLPVVRGLRKETEVPLSIDTSKAEVAREALKAGAALVNDVTGLRDPEMTRTVAAADAGLCLMHMQGSPGTMQQDPRYEDLVAEVIQSLAEACARAEAAGVARDRILVDPGIGFGKTHPHNLLLLRRLEDLRPLGAAILVGTSRKSLLGHLLGGRPPQERLAATLGSIAPLAASGAVDVVRVHDVAAAKDALAVADAMRAARDAGALFDREGPLAGQPRGP